MVTVIILTLNDYAVSIYLDLLCIRDNWKSKMLSDLRTNLCSITIDSLTSCDDQIILQVAECSCKGLGGCPGISTAEYAVNKYGRHQMTEVFLDNFGNNDWVGGFKDYLSACDEYLSLAEQGHPVRKPLMKVLPMALGIGVVLALAVCLFLKSKMKSVRQGAEADAYVTAEGLNLTEQYDRYTHTTKTSRKISKDSDSGSSDHSGGGGSSTSGKF